MLQNARGIHQSSQGGNVSLGGAGIVLGRFRPSNATMPGPFAVPVGRTSFSARIDHADLVLAAQARETEPIPGLIQNKT
jgi:hypothetical protein